MGHAMDSALEIMSPLAVLGLGLGAIGGYTDVKGRIIPNWLTVTVLVVALIVRAVGTESLLAGLGGAGIALMAALPLFLARAIGGGDVKFLTAFGAVLGTGRILPALLLVSVAAGVLALVSAAYRGRVTSLVGDSARLALHSVSLGYLGSRRDLTRAAADPGREPVPLGVAIAAGCMLALFL
jgi:prepilin peptidase CpaA